MQDEQCVLTSDCREFCNSLNAKHFRVKHSRAAKWLLHRRRRQHFRALGLTRAFHQIFRFSVPFSVHNSTEAVSFLLRSFSSRKHAFLRVALLPTEWLVSGPSSETEFIFNSCPLKSSLRKSAR